MRCAMVKVGDYVKVYEPPAFGRADAVVTRVNDDGTIEARILADGAEVSGLVYKTKAGDGPTPVYAYWTELPEGWVP